MLRPPDVAPPLALLFLVLGAAPGCKDKGRSDDTGQPATDGGGTGPDAAPLRPVEPAPWTAPGSVDLASFPWGPQAGDPTQDSVILSVRTGLAEVTGVVMADDGAGGWVEVARPTLTRDKSSVVARATLTGLSADTVYTWAAYPGVLDGDPDASAARTAVGRFRTATGPGAFRQLTLAATSCLGGNEPLSNMSFGAARAPDLGLLLGDTVYADGAVTLEEYRAFYDAAFAVQGLSDFTTAAGNVSTWDDHEVLNNWVTEALQPGQLDAALLAFREALPQGQGPTGGIWRQQSWGDILDIFVLDVRSERDAATGLYIGAEQEAWLLAGLEASPAAFKMVVTSVPITDYDDFLGPLAADDRWQGWPEQRERVLGAIEDAGVSGVFWLAGDVHFATVSTVGIPGTDGPGQAMWELAVGPAGRSPNVAADLYEHDGSHYLYMFSDFNTALLTLDPGRMELHVEFLGDDGAAIQTTTLALGGA